MSKRISRLMIYIGAALIVAAVALMIYNKVDDNLAGKRSQELLDQMMEQMMEQMFDDIFELPGTNGNGDSGQPDSSQRPPSQANSPGGSSGETLSHAGDNPGEDAAESDDGDSDVNTASKPRQAPSYSTLGVLQIPAINLKLPIIDGWTDARGNIAPCSIAGSANFKPRRLIIAGHNLKSHFKSLIDLSVGDEVLFTSKNGETFRYSVIEVGQCHRDNPEEVSGGEGWDITLVTCKTIRTMRTLIRCAEIPAEIPAEAAPVEAQTETPAETQTGAQMETPEEAPAETPAD